MHLYCMTMMTDRLLHLLLNQALERWCSRPQKIRVTVMQWRSIVGPFLTSTPVALHRRWRTCCGATRRWACTQGRRCWAPWPSTCQSASRPTAPRPSPTASGPTQRCIPAPAARRIGHSAAAARVAACRIAQCTGAEHRTPLVAAAGIQPRAAASGSGGAAFEPDAGPVLAAGAGPHAVGTRGVRAPPRCASSMLPRSSLVAVPLPQHLCRQECSHAVQHAIRCWTAGRLCGADQPPNRAIFTPGESHASLPKSTAVRRMAMVMSMIDFECTRTPKQSWLFRSDVNYSR